MEVTFAGTITSVCMYDAVRFKELYWTTGVCIYMNIIVC